MIEKLIGRFCCNARSCIKVKLYFLQFLIKKKKKLPKGCRPQRQGSVGTVWRSP